MASQSRIIRNFYRDSVSLMQLSARLGALPGIVGATAVMATEANLALAEDAGLLSERPDSGANDLLIVVAGDDDATLAAALDDAVAALDRKPVPDGGGEKHAPPRSIAMAVAQAPDANLALIATPGEYAAAEAGKALGLGLNVMLFSDNVSLDDEARLKATAAARGLMVMGPDCGTAIVDGIPLGFANVVRRGDIGVVAASGTGLQQVTCLVERYGRGISQAIGTGGRDLHDRIGGATMLWGLSALAADPATAVVVVVSKPPAPAIMDRVLGAAARAGKPVVVNFIGAEMPPRDGVHPATTLDDAAALAVTLAGGDAPDQEARDFDPSLVGRARDIAAGRRFVRGLYSGGTFCYEAQVLLGAALGPVRSSTPLDAADRLTDPWRSEGHTVIDLGDDIFTRGRPHPMIDHRLRNQRLLREAADPETAVILFDLVLGHGAHPDPAAEMVPVIQRARVRGGAVFVASVCGAQGDPQGLTRQESALADAGVLMAGSNAAAVRLAAAIVAARQGAGA